NLSATLPDDKNSSKDFHLILDASVAELIFNNQHVFTARVYRKPDGPLKISVASSDLSKLESYKSWTLRPISAERLTTCLSIGYFCLKNSGCATLPTAATVKEVSMSCRTGGRQTDSLQAW